MKTIFRKGLFLIAVPVLFQVVCLGILLWIERENAETERWALHTRVVINQAPRNRCQPLRQVAL